MHPAASFLAAMVRLATGVRVRWQGAAEHDGPRIYFANHTSHLDAVVLWGALPGPLRARTRPVAGRDYWERGAVRRYLARRVFRALLVDRNPPGGDKRAAAEATITALVEAVRGGDSLIVFPEGTRGDGGEVGPFKSDLYHLTRSASEAELVPRTRFVVGDERDLRPDLARRTRRIGDPVRVPLVSWRSASSARSRPRAAPITARSSGPSS